MTLDNDTRGWIMAGVSGIACVAGASIICIDLLVQLIPRYRSFRIQDSNTFLSSSLSLSFGVMLFSSLYNMLPEAKNYLTQGGLEPRPAALILITCFLGGVIGISIFSNALHRFIPSHVVDCDHSHDDMDGDAFHDHGHSHESQASPTDGYEEREMTEDTPLLARGDFSFKSASKNPNRELDNETLQIPSIQVDEETKMERPSLQKRLTRQLTVLVSATKANCDDGGPCHGFTDPCGQECFKAVTRSPTRPLVKQSVSGTRRSSAFQRRPTHLLNVDEELGDQLDQDGVRGRQDQRSSSLSHAARISPLSHVDSNSNARAGSMASTAHAHHHHVAANAFLSIGLQTSIAIALHKLPEGFITFATNHANPKLGFAVFMALFVHNITEGFAMALPLYLAINSRGKAMVASAFLGGVSQPMGAGIAALWLSTAQRHDMIPGEKVYGAMFAVTSGIMTAVALQLFSESLGLTHNKHLCIAFAFIGMGILGLSNSLTAS